MSDDHGWLDTGFNGNDKIKTPNMDALADNGIIFDRFYSASAVCSPTRASVITGRNPLRMDIPYANSGHMKREEITLPEILRDHGYSTAHFGKWHLGTLTQNIPDANRGGKPEFKEDFSIPTMHGYDSYFCTESKVPTYDPMIYPTSFIEGENKRFGWRATGNTDKSLEYGTAYWTAENQKETHNLKGDDSRVIMDRVIPFIENAHKQQIPFFTTIWFHTPHLPVVSDSSHRQMYNNLGLREQIYYGAITAMDEQIGRMWQRLEALGIDENTVLFYCSDNGPEVDTPGSAGHFRDRKRSLYEGGIRVPAFVIWKNQLSAGKRLDFPVVTSDYLPTILELLDLDYPSERPLDGMSVLGAMHGNLLQREKPIGFICRPKMSWVANQYKLIGPLDGSQFELYDLLNDHSEMENIIKEFPDIANKMQDELSAWLKSVERSKHGKDYDE